MSISPPAPASATKMVTPNFPSLGDRLRRQLKPAVPVEVPLAEIPLKSGRDGTPLRYRSAVALKFAKFDSSPSPTSLSPTSHSLALAHHIANHWKTPEFEVSVTPPGFLDVTVTDSALAEWLQHLASDRIFWDNDALQPPTSANVPFPVQYACYRCGSLLRLGEREGFVRLDSPEGDRIVDPSPLPWFDLASEPQLRCTHDSERHLIADCAFVADALVADDISRQRRQVLKLATRLAEAFETFHRECRIVGQPRAIAQVRLGLLAVTRVLLKWLLEAGLGVSALAEL